MPAAVGQDSSQSAAEPALSEVKAAAWHPLACGSTLCHCRLSPLASRFSAPTLTEDAAEASVLYACSHRGGR